MLLPLLFIAVLFMFSAALLFEPKFFGAGWMSITLGLGYFAWGAYSTHGVSDELVNPNEQGKMLLGLGLIAFGLLFLALNWFFNIRREMPRR